MHLLDTNIFLEVLLDRENSGIIREYLNRNREISLFVSDFSVYSLGIFLARRKQYDQYLVLLEDLQRRKIQILSLSGNELQIVVRFCRDYGFDFDDAYQITLATQNNLKLVSLDHDFDRIPGGRIHPKDS